jgi:hypothetical protein
MSYALLIYSNPDDTTSERAPYQDWGMYTQSMRDAGVFLAGEPLQAKDTATTLRLRGGKRTVTDGPFAETKELLIGFYILDVADLDAALDWAARMPDAGLNSLEIRPVMGM